MMSSLFSAFNLRAVEFRNRVFVSPMCQYSSREGLPNDWHMVHLGSRAVGGAALVCVEATAVSPEGRISPGDTGLWSEEHTRPCTPIAAFIKTQGARAAIQLAHAGRKASTDVPWRGGKPLSEEQGGWQTVAPSALPFGDWPAPRELTRDDLDTVVLQFADAARRALDAGFEVVELHMAHGYLLHEFLSPLSNRREDEFGGSLENRAPRPRRVAGPVRRVWPDELPLFARISATDWVEGGWDVEQSVVFSRWLKERGVDLIDCSSGGLVPGGGLPLAPGCLVRFAARVRAGAGVATGAAGLITEPEQAEEIIASGKADAVFLARAELRDP